MNHHRTRIKGIWFQNLYKANWSSKCYLLLFDLDIFRLADVSCSKEGVGRTRTAFRTNSRWRVCQCNLPDIWAKCSELMTSVHNQIPICTSGSNIFSVMWTLSKETLCWASRSLAQVSVIQSCGRVLLNNSLSMFRSVFSANFIWRCELAWLCIYMKTVFNTIFTL